MHCPLSGDGGWQVRDVDIEEKGCQDSINDEKYLLPAGKQPAAIELP